MSEKTVRAFIDTNLWVYRVDRSDPIKRRVIADWFNSAIDRHEVIISTQVLVEFCSVVSRKLTPPLTLAEQRKALGQLCLFEVVSATPKLVMDSHRLMETQKLSWFDCLIVTAALESNCGVLYSEDFQHQRSIGELKILNPLV